MAYSLFHTSAPNASDKTRDLGELTTLGFETLGEAITAACNLINRGSIARRIESPSGFIMEKADIEIECWRRREGAMNEATTNDAGNLRKAQLSP